APSTQTLTWRKRFAFAGWFMVIMLLVRAPTLFRSVLDWDESLYLLMAKQWQAGHLPYTTIWDNKPIGIYAIFLVFQEIFGANVAAIRLATTVFVTANATFVAAISYQFLQNTVAPQRSRYAAFAGICYGVASLSNDGLAANTEIFMTAFTTLAMLLAVAPGSQSLRRNAACGLIFGLAVMTKYVAIFEAPALAFALLYFNRPTKKEIYIRRLLATATGGIIPMLATAFVYADLGQMRLWWHDSVISNITRVAANVPTPNIGAVITGQLMNWLLLYVAALMMIVQIVVKQKRDQQSYNTYVFVLLWLGCGGLGVYAAKSFYDHYFLQILPVLCIITVLTYASSGWIGRRVLWIIVAFPVLAGYHALAQAVAPMISMNGGHINIQPDATERGAHDLNLVLQQDQHIYVFDDQPIIYNLTHQSPPTRYIFPSVLTTCFLEKVAGIDAVLEVQKIFAQHPAYVIRTLYPASAETNRNYAVYAFVNEALHDNYHLWKQEGATQIFQLTSNAAFRLPRKVHAGTCGHPVTANP
ncbi:MAG TPA: glycosyltransferase family 39 protein, partial [Halothiobacillus sp.]|nr:glycosyltransferase family 39 protein [Halothiobacillus sp.]